MRLPKELTTVTTTSKLVALIMFLTFPFIGFFLGMRYQQYIQYSQNNDTSLYIPQPSPTITSSTTIEPTIIKKITPTVTTSPIEMRQLTADTKTYQNDELKFKFSYLANWSFYPVVDNRDNEILTFSNQPQGKPVGDAFVGSVHFYKTSDSLAEWFAKNANFTDTKKQEYVKTANSMYGDNFLSLNDIEYFYKEVKINNYDGIVAVTKVNKDNCYFLGAPQCYREAWYIKNKDSILFFFVTTYKNIGNPYSLNQIVNSVEFL